MGQEERGHSTLRLVTPLSAKQSVVEGMFPRSRVDPGGETDLKTSCKGVFPRSGLELALDISQSPGESVPIIQVQSALACCTFSPSSFIWEESRQPGGSEIGRKDRKGEK